MGGIAFLAIAAFQQRMPITGILLVAVCAHVAWQLVRRAGQAERNLTFALLSLTDGRIRGAPMEPLDQLPTLTQSLEAVRQHQLEQQRRIDALGALIDNVSAALLIIRADGSVEPANRMGQKSLDALAATAETDSTEDVLTLRVLRGLAPGERHILRLAGGQRVLATSTNLVIEGVTHSLVATQDIQSELDFVELRAWRDLVQLLAHEMMNSLTPVVTLAESLKPHVRRLNSSVPAAELSTVAADIDEGIDAISRRSQGLVKFVEQYRKIATVPRLNPSRIDLGVMLSRITSLLKVSLEQSSITVQCQVEPPGLLLTADADLVEQALINILINAVEAMKEAPARHIVLRATRSDDRVRIEIADSGPGVEPAQVDRIFLPFYSTKPRGSGIGLSFVKQVVNAHGGQVDVHVNHPSGARFIVSLPHTDSTPD